MTSVPSAQSFPIQTSKLNGIAYDGIRLPNNIVGKRVRTNRVYTPQETLSSVNSGTGQNITGPFAGPVQLTISSTANEQVTFSTGAISFTEASSGSPAAIAVVGLLPPRWRPTENHSFFFEGYLAGAPTMMMLHIAASSGTVSITLATGAGFPVAGSAVTLESCTGSFPLFAATS